MKALVAGLLGWVKGKKTIFGGLLVIAAGVAGVWYGKVDAVTGLGVVGIGLSIAGWANKANRHQAELLTALEGIGQAGADSRAGKPVAGALEATVGSLMPAAIGEVANLGGASLHISGGSADEVAGLAKSLFGTSVTTINHSSPAPSAAGLPEALARLVNEQPGSKAL